MLTHVQNDQSKIIIAVSFMRIPITKIAIGSQAIWEIISSCFGSGVWRSDRPWKSVEKWKNN